MLCSLVHRHKVHGKFCSDSNLSEGEHVEPISSLKSFRKTDLKRTISRQRLYLSVATRISQFKNILIQSKTQAAKIIPLYDFTGEYQGFISPKCTWIYCEIHILTIHFISAIDSVWLKHLYVCTPAHKTELKRSAVYEPRQHLYM